MTRLASIAAASFGELLRLPVYLAVLSGGVAFITVLANLSYFEFGDEARLVKQSVMAFILVGGLFTAAFGAAASISREIRLGTALAVLSKPVGRISFLLGKFAGLAGALGLQVAIHLLAALLASRFAFDTYGDPDWRGTLLVFAALIFGLIVAGASNFFAHRSFHRDAVLATSLSTVLVFVAINCFSRDWIWQPFGSGLDWRLVPVGVLLFFALLVLASIAVMCSTRLEAVPTLVVCTAIFLAGLLSDYVFGRAAADGSTIAAWFHAVIPNWQIFWVADALTETGVIPSSYLLKAVAYVIGQLMLILSLGLLLFSKRELN